MKKISLVLLILCNVPIIKAMESSTITEEMIDNAIGLETAKQKVLALIQKVIDLESKYSEEEEKYVNRFLEVLDSVAAEAKSNGNGMVCKESLKPYLDGVNAILRKYKEQAQIQDLVASTFAASEQTTAITTEPEEPREEKQEPATSVPANVPNSEQPDKQLSQNPPVKPKIQELWSALAPWKKHSIIGATCVAVSFIGYKLVTKVTRQPVENEELEETAPAA